MLNKILQWAGVVALVIAIIACYLPLAEKVSQKVGAQSGDGYTNVLTFGVTGILRAGAVENIGGVLSTTTPASMTLSATDLIGVSTISMFPNVGAITITLPATTTLTSWLPNTGDRTSFVLVNATSTSAITLTVAAGTGSLISKASTTAAVGPGGMMLINVVRKANTDLLFYLSPSL